MNILQTRRCLAGGILRTAVFASLILAALSGLGLFSTITAQAATENQVTVYTYNSFTSKWGPGPKIKKNFEAECGCKLNFVAIDNSVGILSRIRLEGSAGKADVVLGLDTNLMEDARATGLFQNHGVDLSSLHTPIKWLDRTFLPFDFGYFAFIYDSTKLSMRDAPKSFKALIDAPAKLKIIIQDPRTSSPGLGLMLWVKSVYGDQAGVAWKKLIQRTVTVTKGWSEAYGLFLKGEADMVLSYTTSPAYHMIAEKKQQYLAAPFSEGHYLQVELAAMLKNAPNPKLAKRFMTFILSKGFQSVIPTGNWMYPAVNNNSYLPADFSKLMQPSKALQLPPAQVRKNRKAWIKEWLAATSK